MAEGRADLVVAGGADAWSGASALLDGAPAVTVPPSSSPVGGQDVLPQIGRASCTQDLPWLGDRARGIL